MLPQFVPGRQLAAVVRSEENLGRNGIWSGDHQWSTEKASRYGMAGWNFDGPGTRMKAATRQDGFNRSGLNVWIHRGQTGPRRASFIEHAPPPNRENERNYNHPVAEPSLVWIGPGTVYRR
jgi:hypothetical protein